MDWCFSDEVDGAVEYWRKRRGGRPVEAADLKRMNALAVVLDGAIMMGRPRDLETVRRAYNAVMGVEDARGRKRRARDAVRNALRRWGHEPKPETARRLRGHLAPCDKAFAKLSVRTVGEILEARRPNVTAPRIAARLACACGAFDFTGRDEEKARVEFAKL